ncbi:MAG: WXG100 family type VII secretion target [Actinomycetales bacterium]|nr:WXG100 family type VII secretion target [Actinomycetales bacterium]
MAQFQVDSEQISSANVSIQATIAKLQSEVDALHSQLLTLQNSWTGLASAGFQDMVNRWRTTAIAVDSQLNELGQALSLAAQQYSEIEAANLRLFS